MRWKKANGKPMDYATGKPGVLTFKPTKGISITAYGGGGGAGVGSAIIGRGTARGGDGGYRALDKDDSR